MNIAKLYSGLREVVNINLDNWISAAMSTDHGESRFLKFSDISDPLGQLTLQISMRIMLGLDVESASKFDVARIASDIRDIQTGFSRRILMPVPYYRWFKLSADRQFESALIRTQAAIDDLIEEVRSHSEATKGSHTLLRDLVMGMSAPPAEVADDIFHGGRRRLQQEHFSSLSQQEVRSALMQFIIAGTETTTSTTAWCLLELFRHPDWEERLRQELQNILKTTQRVTDLSFDDIDKLEDMKMFIYETTRVHPTTPSFFFENLEDVQIEYQPGLKKTVPAGSFLVQLTQAASKSLWKDPEAFNPNRWLGEQDDSALHYPRSSPWDSSNSYLFCDKDQKFFKTMMFGGGSRVCIGRNLALVEVMLILSALLNSFSIERDSADLDVKESIGFSNRPSAIPLRLRCLH